MKQTRLWVLIKNWGLLGGTTVLIISIVAVAIKFPEFSTFQTHKLHLHSMDLRNITDKQKYIVVF